MKSVAVSAFVANRSAAVTFEAPTGTGTSTGTPVLNRNRNESAPSPDSNATLATISWPGTIGLFGAGSTPVIRAVVNVDERPSAATALPSAFTHRLLDRSVS